MIEGILLSLLGREALDAIKKFFRKKFGHQDKAEKKLHQDIEDIKNLLEKKTGEQSPAPVLLTSRPPRVVKFVGRDKELNEVAALLKKEQQVVLVNGLGGGGRRPRPQCVGAGSKPALWLAINNKSYKRAGLEPAPTHIPFRINLCRF